MPPVPMAASGLPAMPSSPKASTASRETITIWISPTAVSIGANGSPSVRRRVSSSLTSNWSTLAKRSLQMNSGLSWPKRCEPEGGVFGDELAAVQRRLVLPVHVRLDVVDEGEVIDDLGQLRHRRGEHAAVIEVVEVVVDRENGAVEAAVVGDGRVEDAAVEPKHGDGTSLPRAGGRGLLLVLFRGHGRALGGLLGRVGGLLGGGDGCRGGLGGGFGGLLGRGGGRAGGGGRLSGGGRSRSGGLGSGVDGGLGGRRGGGAGLDGGSRVAGGLGGGLGRLGGRSPRRLRRRLITGRGCGVGGLGGRGRGGFRGGGRVGGVLRLGRLGGQGGGVCRSGGGLRGRVGGLPRGVCRLGGGVCRLSRDGRRGLGVGGARLPGGDGRGGGLFRGRGGPFGGCGPGVRLVVVAAADQGEAGCANAQPSRWLPTWCGARSSAVAGRSNSCGRS